MNNPVANWEWNEEQKQAIANAVTRKSFCLIGAAGTGKTTTLRGAILSALENHSIPMLSESTKRLHAGMPGLVLVSYTRRAVRNIARQMPEALRGHCMTLHALLEYEPEVEEVWDSEEGKMKFRKIFRPQRNRRNPLPSTLTTIVIDESSMVSTDLFNELVRALPHISQVQFIFLGDLHQLPPPYGHPQLGYALTQYPVVELKKVYRQALESPIIALAIAVKDNYFADLNKQAVSEFGAPRLFGAQNITEISQLTRPGRGKVTLIPWKKKLERTLALRSVCARLPGWIKEKFYDPEEDLILSPFNEWCDEMNRAVAQTLGEMRNATVFELIAGFEKHYWAVGDKLMVDKQDAVIIDIFKNPKYFGAKPQHASKTLNRWGKETGKQEEEEEDPFDPEEALAALSTEDEDRVNQCSHVVRVKMLDTDEEVQLDTAGQINKCLFGYAITVHKAQGSECRKVFFITDYCHRHMLSRELVYTAITRAAEELVILMPPDMLARAASKPRILGDTLEEKIEFFNKRGKEIAA
jgi:hypothetical protein